MTDGAVDRVAADRIAALVVRQGHFRLESGLHADRWIELDAWFVDPSALASELDALATLLAPYRPTAICGPLTGGAFVAQALAMRMDTHFYFTGRVDGATADPSSTDALFDARYALPDDVRTRAANERFAIVDDVISAGSSARATVDALTSTGASIAVVGAMLVLGRRAVDHFEATGLPLVASRYEAFDCWTREDCPLCAKGIALDAKD